MVLPELATLTSQTIAAYIAATALSAVAFLWMSKNWGDVPKKFYLIHFFIVSWSGLMYMNILYDTSIAELAFYADWLVSTPLIVLALGLSAYIASDSTDWSMVGSLMGLQFMLIAAGLLAHVAETAAATWAFYGISCLFMFGVIYMIWGPLMRVTESNDALNREYHKLGLFVILTWLSYPTIWALGDVGGYGLGVLSDYQVTLGYVILPFLCKAGFGFLDIYLLDRISDDI